MKKHFLILVSLFVFIAMFTACANPSDETGEKVIPGAAESIKTDTIVTTALSESEETPQTTEESTVHTTEAATSTPDDNIELALNMDLIEEYGMSFGELKAKHGELVGYVMGPGDGYYVLENGYGYYWFYTNLNLDNLVSHPEGGFEYLPIEDGKICRGVMNVSPDSLFNKPFETLTIEEIKSIENLTYLRGGGPGELEPFGYWSVFTYDGWNNDRVEISISHKDPDKIDSSSEVKISIHPLRLEENGIFSDTDVK
ncbi:MAG: hypothetical protein E7578_00315 [Ruminococcaceae bacterium]|nr:hypothetical protein [Oscillospiraceae bacterium]